MRARFAAAVCGLVGLVGLAGCAGVAFGPTGVSGSSQSTGGAKTTGAKLTGKVNGGQQPIAGAHVYLFAANTTGYGGNGIAASASNASVSLLTSGTVDTSGGATNGDYYVTTDASGNWTITGDYTCTAGQQVYLSALGGDPGAGENSAAGLMAGLGACPSAGNFATATPYVVINEVSTVATAYAFAGFATDATHVSSSGTALAQSGIANAFANVANLETLSTGAALATTPAGNGTVPQSEINTLGNILAACVNTNGPSSTGCATLFANATADGTSSGAQPTDTATAAINIAHYPGTNVASLYALASGTPPFAPGLGGAPSNWSVTLSYPGGNHVSEVSTPVNHIVWDAAHSSLYASLPNNTVVPINPVTATIGTPIVTGNTPDVLAISSDDSFLYTALDGSSSVIRYTLPSLTLDPGFNLAVPATGYAGQTAISMAVAPSNPRTIAMLVGNYNVGGPNTGGTVVYDDATPRAAKVPYYSEYSDYLGWGSNASTLYATDASSGGDLWVNSVNSSGVTLTKDYRSEVESQTGTFSFDAISGYIYSDTGRVVDPANGNVVGAFNISSFYVSTPRCLPDIANNVVFFIGRTPDQVGTLFHPNTGATILKFNATTYQLIDTISIPGPSGSISDLMRWGNAGLAFIDFSSFQRNASGPVYLVDGSFVSGLAAPDTTTGTSVQPLPKLTTMSPQVAAAGSSSVALNVTGSNFQPGASVLWSGSPLLTNFISASALQATIPASSLSTAGSAVVTVSNGSSGSSPKSLAFTITPASSGTTNLNAVNLASLDIAWNSVANQLIAPVWSADSQFPNSIVAIDPATGAITNSAGVAADPTMARITSDGSFVYTGFNIANQVTRLALPNLTGGTSFSLGNDNPNGDGPWYALDLQPAPGAPQTTAIILGSNGRQPNEGPVVIYDNGVQRPTMAAGFGFSSNAYDGLQWSSNTSTLYADGNDNPLVFYTLAVNSSGVTLTTTDPNSFGSLYSKMHFDSATGYIYDDSGQVINPVTYAQVGTFGASGLLVVDSTLGRVFILGQSASQSGTANYTIQSFNQTTFGAIGSIAVTNVVGTPVAFIRWGTNGLAFVTKNTNASATGGPAGMLYIISDTGFVR